MIASATPVNMNGPQYTLRNLGLWGQPIEEVTDFQWPSQSKLESMPADIYVTKMVCKRDPSHDLDYIQFFMSDGSNSPVVETPAGGKDMEQTINLDEKNK